MKELSNRIASAINRLQIEGLSWKLWIVEIWKTIIPPLHFVLAKLSGNICLGSENIDMDSCHGLLNGFASIKVDPLEATSWHRDTVHKFFSNKGAIVD